MYKPFLSLFIQLPIIPEAKACEDEEQRPEEIEDINDFVNQALQPFEEEQENMVSLLALFMIKKSSHIT